MRTADPLALDLRIRLRDIRPPVWRDLLVLDTFTLDDLHRAIQAVFRWNNSHLYGFEYEGGRYGDPRTPDLNGRDASAVPLASLGLTKGAKLRYIYDFGDYWQHDITVRAVGAALPTVFYPWCGAGRRAAPIDDTGGAPGWEVFVEATSDPSHPGHERMMDWAGLPGPLDPDDPQLAEANRLLSIMFG